MEQIELLNRLRKTNSSSAVQPGPEKGLCQLGSPLDEL
jgi:hypothetical protein